MMTPISPLDLRDYTLRMLLTAGFWASLVMLLYYRQLSITIYR